MMGGDDETLLTLRGSIEHASREGCTLSSLTCLCEDGQTLQERFVSATNG